MFPHVLAGLYGHSCVYTGQERNSLLVYGGVEFDLNETRISANLYDLDLTSSSWSLRLPRNEYQVRNIFHMFIYVQQQAATSEWPMWESCTFQT